MRQIWKFMLPVEDEPRVTMPEGADVLSVQDQGGWLMVWAKVNPDAERVARVFRIFGTGHPMPNENVGAYVGTVQQANGNLVWHVFAGGEEA